MEKFKQFLTTESEDYLFEAKVSPRQASRDVPVDAKLEVLDFLKTRFIKGEHIGTINFRTFVAAVDLYKSGLPNWKELLDYVQ